MPAPRADVPACVSLPEYLRRERPATGKHEYFNGKIRPFGAGRGQVQGVAGASSAHNYL